MRSEPIPDAVVRAIDAGEAAARVAGHWSDTYGVYADLADRVVLTADLQTFLRGCAATNRFPVLMTAPDAEVSPLAMGELRERGAFWVIDHPGGPVTEAVSGAELTSYEQLWRQPAPAAAVGPGSGEVTVLVFDVVAEHRADERTRIGPLAADLIDVLGGGEPLMWGEREPLARPFDIDEITSAARSRMPDGEPAYLRDDSGSWARMVVTRTAVGLREHVRGGVPQLSDATAQLRGVEALTALAHSSFRVQTATVSALRLAAGPAWRAGPDSPEHMVAAYVGPAVLGRTERTGSDVAARHDGALVGRTRVPGVLVELTGSERQRARSYLDLVRDVAGERSSHVPLGA